NVHPGKIVSTSQEVEVIVLEVDEEKRRISLGLKQAQRNPWEVFAETHPVGTKVEGEVKNSTEFGLFIGLDGEVDGMVHMSDIAWGLTGEQALGRHHKGERVQAVVLEVDVEKERISLGIKQLDESQGPRVIASTEGQAAADNLKKNDIITATVVVARDGGIDVQVGDDGPVVFIKRGDLSRDRDEQKAERFQPGQKVDAMIIGFEKGRKPMLSIKAMQISEEKAAVAQYGTSDSGATLGNILGAAFNKAKEDADKG
ncbi:MAG: S1 RNA-binding domain-containing protein, partial [Polymorphobacter sp.]